MKISAIKKALQEGIYEQKIIDLYGEGQKTGAVQTRLLVALKKFEQYYSDLEVSVYSAPGRTEIGGNHTDHQQGCVLAAAVNLDAIAVVSKTEKPYIRLISGEDKWEVSVDVDMPQKEPKSTTGALIEGIVKGFQMHGYKVGGFDTYVTSNVLIGAGLSSSACFEILIGTILSDLYNDMGVAPEELAMIGQYAENVFFGKPCGLMDQMACALGGMVFIDFNNPKLPKWNRVKYPKEAFRYNICITDTLGSHANLTDEYAAIPFEMKQVAGFFDKEVLRDVRRKDIVENITVLRDLFGDRSILRALHFADENERVKQEAEALEHADIGKFLKLITDSGNSSFKYLQNVYTTRNVKEQGISLALMLGESLIANVGAVRVHGGGFAGTVQAFVPKEKTRMYCEQMDAVFGEGACKVLEIREFGGVKLI